MKERMFESLVPFQIAHRFDHGVTQVVDVVGHEANHPDLTIGVVERGPILTLTHTNNIFDNSTRRPFIERLKITPSEGTFAKGGLLVATNTYVVKIECRCGPIPMRWECKPHAHDFGFGISGS